MRKEPNSCFFVFKDSNGASAASTKKILGIEPPYTVLVV